MLPFAVRVEFKFLRILTGSIVARHLFVFLALTTPALHPYARLNMYQFYKCAMLYLALSSFMTVTSHCTISIPFLLPPTSLP